MSGGWFIGAAVEVCSKYAKFSALFSWRSAVNLGCSYRYHYIRVCVWASCGYTHTDTPISILTRSRSAGVSLLPSCIVLEATAAVVIHSMSHAGTYTCTYTRAHPHTHRRPFTDFSSVALDSQIPNSARYAKLTFSIILPRTAAAAAIADCSSCSYCCCCRGCCCSCCCCRCLWFLFMVYFCFPFFFFSFYPVTIM